MIFLRFGTLEKREKIWHTANQVKKLTGVSMKTQYGMIRRWLDRCFKDRVPALFERLKDQ